MFKLDRAQFAPCAVSSKSQIHFAKLYSHMDGARTHSGGEHRTMSSL